MTVGDVIWKSYVDHRVHLELDDIALFRVIYDGRVFCLDISLSGICANFGMSRTFLDHSLDGLCLTLSPMSLLLERMKWWCSSLDIVWMVTKSGYLDDVGPSQD